MYTQQQFKSISKLMSDIQDMIETEIYYKTGYITNINELTSNPDLLDEILNLQRLKDMCFLYLIDPTQGSIGHSLINHSEQTIDKFINSKKPIDILNFFSKENIVKDYILENCFDKINEFKNDDQYQNDYQTFIK